MNSRTKSLSIAGLAAVATLALAGPANAAAIANSAFEADAVGATNISSWTEYLDIVDLGVTQLGGCTTVDTSDYSTLRGWDDYVADPSIDPLVGQDSRVTGADLPDPGAFTVEIVDGTLIESTEDENNVEIVLATTSKVANLRSDMNTDSEDPPLLGYVMHGPAIVSDVFTAGAGNTIDVRWAASGDEDDFHVFGYLLNTATCAQTEVIDATGAALAWTDVSVSVPSSGSYRFVFVSGTYDQSWGGAAGGVLYIDEVELGGLADTGFELGGSMAAAGSLALVGAVATAGVYLKRRRLS
jgi:hypothetical protein